MGRLNALLWRQCDILDTRFLFLSKILSLTVTKEKQLNCSRAGLTV